jgi:hypothetical protein
MAAAAELLLERELKFDCEDCCNVARASLDLIRSREQSSAPHNNTDTDTEQNNRVSAGVCIIVRSEQAANSYREISTQ